MTVAAALIRVSIFLTVLLCFLSKPIYAEALHSSPEQLEPTSICYFIPPLKWDLADPRYLAPKVKIGFLTKPRKGFCPSINLAIEETNASLQEYLKAVKNLHEADHQNRWRELGKVKTKAGTAVLTEIDTKADLGPVRILQLILLRGSYAYILTAAARKEDLSLFYDDFLQAFRSFDLIPDLLSVVSSPTQKESLEEKMKAIEKVWHLVRQEAQTDSLTAFQEASFQKNHWIPFQNYLLKEFSEYGSYWQLLVLQDLQKKLFACTPSLEGQSQPSLGDEQNDTKEDDERSPFPI